VLLLGLLSIWLWLAGSRKHSSPPHYSKCFARQLLLRLLRAFIAFGYCCWRAGWPVCGALILEMLLAGVTRSARASVSACQRLLALLLPQRTFACER
jgi:hypothetical protein